MHGGMSSCCGAHYFFLITFAEILIRVLNLEIRAGEFVTWKLSARQPTSRGWSLSKRLKCPPTILVSYLENDAPKRHRSLLFRKRRAEMQLLIVEPSIFHDSYELLLATDSFEDVCSHCERLTRWTAERSI